MLRVLRLCSVLVVVLSALLAPALPAPAQTTQELSSLSFTAFEGQAVTRSHKGATLEIGADAVAGQQTISMTALGDLNLPLLEQGMTNVTPATSRGYRFLPHMFFRQKIKIRLPYDPALIPAGLTENDIKTFYFDEQAGLWKELERVRVDTQRKEVISFSNHFTDMVNATITVPDHPQALSYNPTSIKDIKAADPGAQINLIEPPAANNSGDARLSYPIQIPPGRQGMQPGLALQYNSSGGNGWMGLGWDLAMQTISIDTRWGVPRYDPGKETETYLLNGEQLTPVAHRGELVARSAEKIFHTRVEGQFQQIIRHGSHPRSYWWEVVDKNGTRFFYGGDAQSGGPLPDATLSDLRESVGGNRGNIFLWSLREIRDTNGNFVKYRYARVADRGVPGAPGEGVAGHNLYLDHITYTGYNGVEGPYSVRFTRDRQLVEERRPDVSIDARGGFKRVTADLLRRVDITLNDSLVRRYEFLYTTGAFTKTLLRSVIQYGEHGQEFNRHSFSYYDEARDASGTYLGFAASTDWDMPGDNISAGLLGRGLASALGGSVSTSRGGHFYAGVGPASGSVKSKNQSIGFKAGHSKSKSEGLLSLTDIDGDNLPDKLFKRGSGFAYRENLSGPDGQNAFQNSPPSAVTGMRAILRESVTTTTRGIESFFGLPVLRDTNRATTQADSYLTDVNGDGLTDQVSAGRVWFAYIDSNGKPAFSLNSADTPVPIGAGAVDTAELLENAEALEAERANDYPLLDTVRRWVAPYAGRVQIAAPVRLLEDTSSERAEYDGADGVRVAIQIEGAELWSQTIAAADHAVYEPAGLGSLEVRAGDHVYFRVQSIFDGAYDRVAWDPLISYLDVDSSLTDVNDLPVYDYRASEDFTLAGRQATVTAPVSGTLHLAGSFEKRGATTDDVTLLITRNGGDVYRRTFGFDEVATLDLAQDLAVMQLDEIEWRVLVDSPIDASLIRFMPVAYYTLAEGVEQIQDEQGNYLLQVNPPYAMDLYPLTSQVAPQQFYTAPSDGAMAIEATATVTGLDLGQSTSAVLTVKRRGALLAKQLVEFQGPGAAPDLTVTQTIVLNLPVSQGDQLYFDLSSRDSSMAGRIGLEVRNGIGLGAPALPSAVYVAADEGLFAQPYRGWSSFGYNGNSPRDTQPINQSLLVIDESYDPEQARVYPFAPNSSAASWYGPDESAWVKADEVSASRLGLDDIRMPRSAQFAGASAVARISRSLNRNKDIGVGSTDGESASKLEFQDLNGDRFPDVISHSGVQYTRMTGELEPVKRNPGLGSAREATSVSVNIGTSGLGSLATAVADARAGISPIGFRPAPTSTQDSDMPPIGFGGDLSSGSSDTLHELIDINGDGLPDKVYKNGSASLNLGYRFAAAEPWAAGSVNEGETLNAGVNMGFNRNAYSMAGGLNLSIGTSRSDETYADINGDGLPDKVIAGRPLQVRLNNGTGFEDAIDWPGGHGDVAVDKHISLGGGVYFTFGFKLKFIRFVFNPGINFSTSMGRPELAFRDIDGDGYADHLFSASDSELKVARNQIGRTNLLRSVQRPLGASFELEYTRDGNTYELPQSRWVLSRLKLHDGVTGDGVDTLVTTFAYAGGQYNRLEREFYGYQLVSEQHRNAAGGEALYRSIVRQYRSDSYYTRGLLASELTSDAAGNKFLETQHTYLLRNVDTGAQPATGDSTTATIFPMLTRTDRRFYEGQPTARKSTYTTHEYDSFGNVIRFLDAGDAGAGDDVDARIDYSAADPLCRSRHLLGLATTIEVLGDSQRMRRRTATIDCATGNLTQVRQVLEGGQQAVTDLAFFPNGNLQALLGPPNQHGQRYQLSYHYDPAVLTHVTLITDSFQYASSATYNLKYGAVQSTTDINGNTLSYAYDHAGRVVGITGPYDRDVSTPTIAFHYHEKDAVPWALTSHLDRFRDAADTIDTVLFTDGLKRVLQTKKDATLHTGPNSAPVNGMIVSGRLSFDFAGRTVAQSYPLSEALGSPGAFNRTIDDVPPTRIDYDVLDRTVRTTLPDTTATTMSYGFGYDRDDVIQFSTTVTDANGIHKTTYRDVRDLITSVQEFHAEPGQTAQPIWTSYSYDPLKQIVAVRDAQNNLTTVRYDLLGRRTSIDSPDTGRVETVYDLASNLIARITPSLRAEGKQISYDYEFNRLKRISYPNFAGNQVSYSYGEAGAGDNRAGRITLVTDQSGSEERFYGKLGEVVKEIKTVASATLGSSVNAPEVYTTQYLYDSFGRLQRLTYPDGELLTYRYDSGGLVREARGEKLGHSYSYVNKLEYDKFEQRAFVEAGNGISTRYSYDPRSRRLAGLKAGKASGNLFQNLSYGYDKVGNILRLSNEVPLAPASSFGGPVTQIYAYDDLYRLTGADGSYEFSPGKVDRYSLEMRYDNIHNIVAKAQSHEIVEPSGIPIRQQKTSYSWSYAYAGPQPHAPTHIGEQSFSYDANGNQLGWTHDVNGTRRAIVWDEESRIQSTFDNGHEVKYVYNDAGERVIKRGPQGETVYVNQYFTMRNREIGTKHVVLGNSRLVSKLLKQDKPGANPAGSTPLEKDLYFYHADHLGSSSYVTKANGDIYEHMEYFAFGEVWVEEVTNIQRTPHRFTSKELDEETGLAYYGARYYDPRTSVWQSPDPILGEYLDGNINSGVYTSINLSLYGYSHNNPIIMTDPTGMWPEVWDKASPQEKAFAKNHPWAAWQIGKYKQGSTNISTVATTFAFMGASKEQGSILSKEDENKSTGGQNALRHVLLQAFTTAEFNEKIAEESANAHENNTPVDMKRTTFSSYAEADMAVDYRNNIIGRQIGSESPDQSRLGLTKTAVEKFRKEGFWMAYRTQNGFELRQTKLSKERYEAYRSGLEHKDNNARWVEK